MSLNMRVTAKVDGSLVSDLDLSSSGQVHLNWVKQLVIASGVAADQATQLWFDTRTLAGAAADEFDLVGGLEDGLGEAISFNSIKGFFMYSEPTNTENIAVGGGLAPWASWVGDADDVLILRPGGLFCLLARDEDAYEVTPITGDGLLITNLGLTDVVYEIILFGI